MAMTQTLETSGSAAQAWLLALQEAPPANPAASANESTVFFALFFIFYSPQWWTHAKQSSLAAQAGHAQSLASGFTPTI
jgi:hypothetical protein